MYKIGFFLGLVLIVLGLIPLGVLWAVNVLLPVLAIPYTFETWLAVVTLSFCLRSSISLKNPFDK